MNTPQPDPSELRHCGPAVPERLPALRHKLAAWARRQGLGADAIADLALACYEAMTNVVVHAYRGQLGLLDVRASRPNHHLTVTITDHGSWRRPTTHRSDLGGRGLSLIRMLADEADIVPGPAGTTVRLRWNLHPTA